MFTLIHNAYTNYKEKNSKESKITLVILGLNNAGKTTLLAGLQGQVSGAVAPTVGFNREVQHLGKNHITFYDLGGGAKIRGIWSRYFAEVHGIIFVVDAADKDRLAEAKDQLEKTLSAECVPGKPVLIFANKQDLPTAMAAADISTNLGMPGHNVKHHVQACTGLTPEDGTPDARIGQGLKWLLDSINSDFSKLSARVAKEFAEQQAKEKIERAAQRERAAAAKAARLAEAERLEREEAAASTATGDTAAAGATAGGPQEGAAGVGADADAGSAVVIGNTANNITVVERIPPGSELAVTDDVIGSPTKQSSAGPPKTPMDLEMSIDGSTPGPVRVEGGSSVRQAPNITPEGAEVEMIDKNVKPNIDVSAGDMQLPGGIASPQSTPQPK